MTKSPTPASPTPPEVIEAIRRHGGEECPIPLAGGEPCRAWHRASPEAREFHRRRSHAGE